LNKNMSLQEEEAARLQKLNTLIEKNINPYPARATRTHTISQILLGWDELVKKEEKIILVGRIKTKRAHGGLIFANLEDGTDAIQIALKRDHIGEETFNLFNNIYDLGDFIEVEGSLFLTKTEQKTLEVKRMVMLTKSLLPLPEKWHGLSDTEIRYRKRYLDLISNKEVRDIFQKRGAILKAIRDFFDSRGYLEVETPILQSIPGGANAKPFITHHNALDIDLYLRVAPELHLKRLLVGGIERVYEIARCFRNEGIDHLHNPEFTQIEAYEAYANYNTYMEMIEELLPSTIEKIGLDAAHVPFNDTFIDFTPPYPRITFRDAIKKETRFDINDAKDRSSLAKAALKLGVEVAKDWSHGKIFDEIYKKHVRTKILNPVFIIDHPIELSPLSKVHPNDPTKVERFQLVLGEGTELVNAFSELNDPIDQENRFKKQDEARGAGDEEAQYGDANFVDALKHGMPPAAGLGIGIDRLTALLTNSHSIKEVILFPTLRPESEE